MSTPKAGILKELIAELGITVYEFEKNVGVSRSRINNAINRNSAIPVEIIAKIIARYPQVSKKWLETGKGAIFLMANETNDPDVPYNPNNKQSISDSLKSAGDYIVSTVLSKSRIGKMTRRQHELTGQIMDLVAELAKELQVENEKTDSDEKVEEKPGKRKNKK